MTAVGQPRSKGARIGFSGLGWIGRHRLAAALQSGAVVAAAVLDPDPTARESSCAIAPDARCCTTFEELLDQGLDGVVVATPSVEHAPQALRALERGCHVFCQKPLATHAADAAAVVAAARKRDLLLAVDFSYRRLRGLHAIRHDLRAGVLGDVYAAELRFHNAYGPDKPWFYDFAASGGGCLMDLGVHLIDLLLWLFDDPPVAVRDAVLCREGRRLPSPVRAVEDYAELALELDGGRTSARITTSWKLPAGCDAEIELSLWGTRGGARIRNRDGSFYDFVVERTTGTTRQVLAEPPDAWGGRMIQEWAARVAAGAGFDPRAERCVTIARLLDEVYQR